MIDGAVRVWSRYRWVLIAAAVVATVVLGLVGYRGSWPDRSFASLRLLVGAYDADLSPDPTPLALNVARFLGLAVSFVVVLTAIAALLARRTEELRASLQRDHIVVCGLGSVGRVLARTTAQAGGTVVAIDRDAVSADTLSRAAPRVLAVVGDAGDPETLRRAGARRARAVVCVCGTDAENLRAANAAAIATEGARRRTSLIVSMDDPDVSVLFRRPGLSVRGAPTELFSVYERAARSLLLEPPLSDSAGGVIIVGEGRLMRALVLQATRSAVLAQREDPQAPAARIAVIGRSATQQLGALEKRALIVTAGCRLESVDTDPAADPAALQTLLTRGDWGGVVICTADESEGLKIAASIVSTGIPVLLRSPDDGRGLFELMPARLAAVVHPFSVAGRASVAGLIQETTIELLARAVHQAYRRSTPAPLWEDLDERLREDNRDHARAMEQNLALAWLLLGPLVASCAPLELDPAEIEVLSGLEHERWRLERHRRSRPPEFSPYDRPWPELDDHAREQTRRLVCSWPSILDASGLQIDRDPRRLRLQQALNARVGDEEIARDVTLRLPAVLAERGAAIASDGVPAAVSDTEVLAHAATVCFDRQSGERLERTLADALNDANLRVVTRM